MYFSLVLNDLSPSLLSGTRANDARAFRAWKCSTWHSDPTWTSQAGNSLCIPLHVLILCCQRMHVVTKHCQFIHIILHQQRNTCPVSYLHVAYVVIQSDYYVASCCTLYIACSHDFFLQDIFFHCLNVQPLWVFSLGPLGLWVNMDVPWLTEQYFCDSQNCVLLLLYCTFIFFKSIMHPLLFCISVLLCFFKKDFYILS